MTLYLYITFYLTFTTLYGVPGDGGKKKCLKAFAFARKSFEFPQRNFMFETGDGNNIS